MKRHSAHLIFARMPILALGVLLFTGCVAMVEPPPPKRPGPPPWAPAHGYRAKFENYYYYPSIQVYYYPKIRRYFWLDAGKWKAGVRLPRGITVEGIKRVVLDLDFEPHKFHHRILSQYPPGY